MQTYFTKKQHVQKFFNKTNDKRLIQIAYPPLPRSTSQEIP